MMPVFSASPRATVRPTLSVFNYYSLSQYCQDQLLSEFYWCLIVLYQEALAKQKEKLAQEEMLKYVSLRLRGICI